jgi:hypothetical protein
MVAISRGTVAIPSPPLGEVARTLSWFPRTTAAPATSPGAPELYSAKPTAGASSAGAEETAALAVMIGLGSVTVNESWIVPPGGALASRILRDRTLVGSDPLDAVSRRPAVPQRASTRKSSRMDDTRL